MVFCVCNTTSILKNLGKGTLGSTTTEPNELKFLLNIVKDLTKRYSGDLLFERSTFKSRVKIIICCLRVLP